MTSLISKSLVCCSALLLAPGCAFVPSSRSVPRVSSPTALYDTSSSNSANRARVEQIFEESMGNDWRLFRAQLIAQEQAERSQEGGSSFSTFHDAGKHNQDPRRAEEFCDTVVSVVFPPPSTTNVATSDGSMPQDPFVSQDEMPIHFQPKIRVNKHRWAHPIDHIEIGCILIANEELQGVFEQTVVLVVDHDEETGTTGVIINRPHGNLMEYANRFEDEPSNLDLKTLKHALPTSPMAFGGPYKPEILTVLHGYGEVDGAKKLAPGVFIGGAEELETEACMGRLDPSDTLFVKGHGSWVPGQLYNEIDLGVWYTASCSSDFLLRYAGAPITEDDNPRDLWSDILTCMGGEYAEVAREYGGQGDHERF